MDLKGVLFDFGDTLAYVDRERNNQYRKEVMLVLRKNGYEGSSEKLDEIFDETYWLSSRGDFQSVEEFWESFLRRLGVKGTLSADKLEKVRKTYQNSLFKLYDGVFDVLSHLKRLYKLALVSNCAIGTFDMISHMGLVSFFESIVLSYEIRIRKPDRRVHLEALRHLSLEPCECIFVADEISDLEGAREVGLKTLLVKQGTSTMREAKDVNFKPDYECDRIQEIKNLL
ncbi:MAG: HAD-IA family hydrolase [Candidatus Bathyarchaeota archaeon]|nr:HAD-IA family hydrolase [Candidatus Bathyarchaeota archaeon]MDH5787330.1 HAD-IA family hydrolase [Candidatus Bathyarchaeota archaeon]